MAFADLYIESINFLKYINKTECNKCGFPSCDKFIESLIKGVKRPHDCVHINKNMSYAFQAVKTIKDLWPDVPLLVHPRPSLVGLVELNNPNPDSLVLVTGNNEYTEQILLTVLGTTICPFFVLFVDTDGNTVDMSMVYNTLTADRIYKAFEENDINSKIRKKEIIIPGLAYSIKEDIETLTGWRVRIGPVCAAELPLFLSEVWIPPEE